MAKGYWVVNLNVTDPERYKEYQAFVRPFLAANDGRFLVRGGALEVVEGRSEPRIVVIEFPTYEKARQVYHSAEYQDGMRLRLGAATTNFVVVEGLEG
jgi:uncharacterized protein (DUF1330 family)